MKISTSMLKKYYKAELTDDELYNITNEYITEVESFEKLIDANNFVVGYVNESNKHPNADKLSVCQVDLGNGITEQIVCGADNVAIGQYVIVAKVGAILPGDFEIKQTSIRGVESNGMICSLEELGFDKKDIEKRYRDGIYYFDSPKDLGTNALEALNLNQSSLELELTPNRADLLSVLGFAYDLAAATNEKIEFIEPEVKEIGLPNPLKVKIENEDCIRYYARYLDNITVKSSPLWLQADLLASGIRPVNNVVDITNYVLLEYGIPLHAFDANKFETNEIVVKKAQDLMEVVTLDEQIKVLKAQDIIITNGEKATAIAGVMGLLNTAVKKDTTSIILEAASFSKESIRKTSRRLDIISDSSIRFERGIDETRVRKALNRASQLLSEITGARVYQGIAYQGDLFNKPTIINFDLSQVNKHLGTNLDVKEVKAILSRLNIVETKENHFLMPTYRNDLENKADLIEEVARIYGYNNIPTILPKTNSIGGYNDKQRFINNVRKHFVGLGFNEVINYSLIDEKEISLFKESSVDIIKLLHPMREDRAVLRHSLVNGLVENIKYHLARQHQSLKFFEIGSVYYTDNEPNMLAVIITNDFVDGTFTNNSLKTDYYLLKGILNTLFKKYNLELITEKENAIKGFHPGITAKVIVNEKTIGTIGKIHPTILKDAYSFEINLELLYEEIKPQEKFKQISKYPNISRDIAIVVNKDIPVQQLIDLITQTTKRYLIDLKVFDIYYDEKLGENKISIGFSLTFNSVEKTLKTKDVDKLMRSVIIRLEREYNAEVRQ